MSFLRFLSLVVLAAWVGGLAVLGGIAAPIIFDVLQLHDPVGGRTLAGELFGAIFHRFQIISWILGGVLLALLGARAALGPRPRRLGPRLWIVIGMLAISIGSVIALVPRIDRLRRESSAPIATLDDTDPRKVEFGRLHGLSSGLMLLTLLGGLGLLWFEVRDTH